MAAHVLTGLRQLRNGQCSRSQIMDALNLSCWTEDLDFSDYCDLSDLVNVPDEDYMPQRVSSWAGDRINQHYYRLWVSYGCPETREEWREAWLGK